MGQMKAYTLKEYAEVLDKNHMLADCQFFDCSDTEAAALTFNSKEVQQGSLFICKGAAFREEYVNEAAERGAICYVSEKQYHTEHQIPYILVKDIRKAMAVLANMYYCRPWQDLRLVGIGGTKGKSTSTYYMKAIVDDYLEAQQRKESAVISSIDIYDGKQLIESHITTPEAIELQRYLRNALDCGIEYAQMEISSQALKYHRVDGMRFDVAVFLNISEDHISPIEHADFEDYFESKMRMFGMTDTAVVNLDTDCADRVLEASEAAGEVITFSLEDESADYYAYDIRKENSETKFMVRCSEFEEQFVLTMPGIFNVENAMGVICAAVKLGIPRQYIHSGLYRAKSKGRMQMYSSKDQKIIAIVDYAHNKLSFEKLFSSMKQEYPDYEIVAIFGCPGRKALLRRKDLGTIAGQYASKVYLTAEDPGAEPVEQISRDIAKYVEAQNCSYEIIEDRGEAIKAAIEPVEGKTLLLVTGKGEETRQKYGNEYIECPSDVEYVKRYLEAYDLRTAKEA